MNSKFGGITSISLPTKLWNQNFTDCAIDIFRKDMNNLPSGYRFLCISSAERFSFKILSLKQDRKTPLEEPEPKYKKKEKSVLSWSMSPFSSGFSFRFSVFTTIKLGMSLSWMFERLVDMPSSFFDRRSAPHLEWSWPPRLKRSKRKVDSGLSNLVVSVLCFTNMTSHYYSQFTPDVTSIRAF